MTTTTESDNQTREERNEYRRQWYRDNKHKHARHQIRYWKKKLEEYEADEANE